MIAYNKNDKKFYNVKVSFCKITYYENGFGWSYSYISNENMEKDWLLPVEEAEGKIGLV